MNEWCFRSHFCTVRLYWAGVKLGKWDEFCHETCPRCKIDQTTYWSAVKRSTTILLATTYIHIITFSSLYSFNTNDTEDPGKLQSGRWEEGLPDTRSFVADTLGLMRERGINAPAMHLPGRIADEPSYRVETVLYHRLQMNQAIE